MSKMHKKVSTNPNYIEHFRILIFAVTEFISISAFSSLIGISVRVTSSAIGLKIRAITAGMKRY